MCSDGKFDMGSPPRMRGKLLDILAARASSRITPADAGKTCTAGIVAHADGDHPRGCGENCRGRRNTPEIPGSPPRMRGKRYRTRKTLVNPRITPADAGKTLLFCLRSWRRWDHPRGCGENDCNLRADKQRLGSPPRMRGKH